MVSGGVLAAPGASAVAATLPRSFSRQYPRTQGPGPEVAAFLGELRAGAQVGGFTVAAIHAPTAGVIPMVLVGADGVAFQVDVARRDPLGPTPVAETEHLALYLANRANGTRRTVEDHGLAVRALADQLRRREQSGAPLPQLATLRERVQQDWNGMYHVLG